MKETGIRYAGLKQVLAWILLPALCASYSAPVHAYIDPVTGSFLVQGLIAAFAAAMVFFRSLRDRIVGFFRPSKPKEEASEVEATADSGER